MFFKKRRDDSDRRRGLRVSISKPESLESRTLLSAVSPVTPPRSLLNGYIAPISLNRPILPLGAAPNSATFIDPTAVIGSPRRVGFGSGDFVGPYVLLLPGRNEILVGSGTNLQDNVTIRAQSGSVLIGDQSAIAHGATIIGPATIGSPGGAAAFLGFNAVVDASIVQGNAMVSGLAWVGPGVVIHSGFVVLPGAHVTTQAEADNPALGMVRKITPADQRFVAGVLHVNDAFASGYASLAQESTAFVKGVGPNPDTSFNSGPALPTVGGFPVFRPNFRDRVIGKVNFAGSLAGVDASLGRFDSIRGDEGYPLGFAGSDRFAARVTFHAIEHTAISIGTNDFFGFHSIVHGGTASATSGSGAVTIFGNDVILGPYSVVYQSNVGNDVVIGAKSYIQTSSIPSGTVVPPRSIIIGNQYVGKVGW